jgi:pyridoxal phosphate enzyme (YggS family)
MAHLSDISGHIRDVRKRIDEAAVRSKRQAADVTLLAVTKTMSIETIQKAYEAGLRDFGENRVQEALQKMGSLPSDVRWHLIGQLQSNKINKIIGKFVLIHSVDSLHLAETLSSRVGSGNQEVLLEVNTSGEASKGGVTPEEAVVAAEKMMKLPALELRGLMTVGPLTEDLQKQREAFKKLKGLFESIRQKNGHETSFSVLSMGMSGDFEMAIEEGSTLVRVGRALFGPRS